MWTRNLLFLSVCLAGLLALAGMLSPSRPQPTPHDPSASTSEEFRTSVARVNDAFRQHWGALKIEPTARAKDLTVARRMSLALAGTIPSLEEIRAFEEQPPPERLDWHLAGLLEDRRSGDYLAERFARALVGVEDGPFLIYRRRRFVAWLADQLHASRPYDEIVREVIATSGLWTDRPATNFITVTIKPDEKNEPDGNALAARVSRAFLGVRLDCAECHDHPFRQWKQADFQSLAAFFGQTKQSFTGIRDENGPFEVEERPSGKHKTIEPAVPFYPDLLPSDGTARERLAAWITHPNNDAFAKATVNRAWAILFGRPLVEPIDDLSPPSDPPRAELAKGAANSDDESWSAPTQDEPAALAILADDFVQHGHDLRRLLSLIASTEAFRLNSRAIDDAPGHEITPTHEAAWAAFPVTRLRPEQVVGGVLQSASLETIGYQSHILVRIGRAIGQGDFVQRYGDSGEEEFAVQGATIPQRLLLMNGDLVAEKTKENLLTNAATQIAAFASTDQRAVETAYLAVLTRRPTAEEAAHFAARLSETGGDTRNQRMEDLYWTLINSTEFSWNH